MTPKDRELMQAIDEMIRYEYREQTLEIALAEPQLRDYLMRVWRQRDEDEGDAA
jgi:hypothetical protein